MKFLFFIFLSIPFISQAGKFSSDISVSRYYQYQLDEKRPDQAVDLTFVPEFVPNLGGIC